MKTVLIADDDQELLDRQLRSFSEHRREFRVLTASDGAEAQQLLKENDEIDVLVTDLEMPVMDGFELLAHVLQRYPSLPIIVMSDHESDSLGVALEAAGSTDYVRKPLQADTLVHRIRAVFARRARGHVSGISLASFLQLLHLDKRTCTLTVRWGGQRGTLELTDGEITNASFDGLKGEKAVYKILAWRQPDIELTGTLGSGHREIHASLQQLLIEAARQQDESARDRPVLAPRWLDGPLEPTPSTFELEPAERDALRAAFQQVLLLEGALGITLLDVRSSSCVLTECRGLSADFERTAGALASFFRSRLQMLEHVRSDDEIENLVVHLSRHVEIFCTYGSRSHLVLYLLGERGRLAEAEAIKSLHVIGQRPARARPDRAPATGEPTSEAG